ncbi:reactive mitochondrial oxygen species modulator 1-domain-containing protein [Daldinia grandis]|nr:reactive mitochondrial oxygen species modulator 1-domain-containing protein [Daldinia grandis]
MPPVPTTRGPQGPSTVDKLKMGAMMGGTVGVIIGFIFGTLHPHTSSSPRLSGIYGPDMWCIGTVNIFRYGAGHNGIMRTLGQYMLGSGATFGFFMSIGSVIRTDASPIAVEAFARAQRRPFIMPSQSSTYRPRSQ